MKGLQLSDDQLKRIYGPAGLEIGSETPEEIALSIVSEIKAVFSEKEGGSLRNKKEVIHSRKETLIETKELILTESIVKSRTSKQTNSVNFYFISFHFFPSFHQFTPCG